MRKITISSMIVVATILLSACSSPTALFQNGAANTNNNTPETEGVQPAQPITYAKPVVQATAPALPASEASSLLAAYEGQLTSVYETVNPSVVNIRVVQKACRDGSELAADAIPLPFCSRDAEYS